MLCKRALESSRLFLYLGFGLIFVSLILLPVKVRYWVGDPVWGKWEYFSAGLLFAPVIGVWGLPSLMLGIAESSMSKIKTTLCLIPILGLVNIWIVFIVWTVNPLFNPFGRDYFGLNLIPNIIANMIGFLYFTKKEKLAKALENQKIRILTLSILITIPLLFAVALLFPFVCQLFGSSR